MFWPSRTIHKFNLPYRLCSFGFIDKEDDKLITAFENGFAIYEPETSKIQWLSKPETLSNGIRLNDGRVGPDGRFWAGSMHESNMDEKDLSRTGLFKLDHNGQADFIRSGLNITNSTCWDPSRNRMYYSDSTAQEIYYSTYDLKTGALGPQVKFIKLEKGHPDGAVIDIDGNLWVTIWGDSKVICFDPMGQSLAVLPIPVPQPSCLTFGGPSMNLLFVTSARTELTRQDLVSHSSSGAVFVYETNVMGRDIERYIGLK